MKIKILEERLDQWRRMLDLFPESERTIEYFQRFKRLEDSGPDFFELWNVTGSTETYVRNNLADWSVE
mgnify:CR=1 FL=1